MCFCNLENIEDIPHPWERQESEVKKYFFVRSVIGCHLVLVKK